MERLKAVEKELAASRAAALLSRAGELAGGATSIGTLRAVVTEVGEVSSADDLRSLALDVRARLGATGVVALIGTAGGRPIVAVAVAPDARDAGVKAGALVRVAATALGGGGGGKDDVAQGGGTNAAAIPAALHELETELRKVTA